MTGEEIEEAEKAQQVEQHTGQLAIHRGIELVDQIDGGAHTSDRLVALGRLRCWLDALEAQTLAALDATKHSAVVSLCRHQRTSGRTATRRVGRAKTLAAMSAASAALALGEINSEHVTVLGRALRAHRDQAIAQQGPLVDAARSQHPELFGTTVSAWINSCDGDGGADRHLSQRRRRGATISQPGGDDAMVVLHAQFDAVAGATVKTAVAHLAERLWRSDNQQRFGASLRETCQRNADALEEMATSYLTGNSALSDPHNAKALAKRPPAATVILVAEHEMLRDQLDDQPDRRVGVQTSAQTNRIGGGVGPNSAGRCELADGTPVSVDTLRRLACEAAIVPAIFDTSGDPLWVGRRQRLATDAQRLAVIARDRTCVVDGCGTPSEWCQIHHIKYWSQGGGTDIDNLALVCTNHHHLIHEGHGQLIQHRLQNAAAEP